MIARGALGNPFIFKRYNQLCDAGTDPGEPALNEIKDVCYKHLDYLLEEFEENLAVNKVKKHIIWYFRQNTGIDFLTDKIFSARSKAGIVDLVEQHTENLVNGAYKEDTIKITNQKFNDRVVFWTE